MARRRSSSNEGWGVFVFLVIVISLVYTAVHWVWVQVLRFWDWLGWWHWVVFLGAGLVALFLIVALIGASIAAARERAEAQRAAARERAEAQRRQAARLAEQRRQQAARQVQLDKEFGYALSLDPYKFEDLIARLLRRVGFADADSIGGANDRGADVIGNRHGERVVVQCKRYQPSNKVKSGDMQKFVGMCYDEHEADIALFVTTSTFTKEARAIGMKRGVYLVDGPALSEWQAFGAPSYLRIGQQAG